MYECATELHVPLSRTSSENPDVRYHSSAAALSCLLCYPEPNPCHPRFSCFLRPINHSNVSLVVVFRFPKIRLLGDSDDGLEFFDGRRGKVKVSHAGSEEHCPKALLLVGSELECSSRVVSAATREIDAPCIWLHLLNVSSGGEAKPSG